MDYPKIIKNHTKIVITRKKDGEKVTILDTSDSQNRVTGKVVAGLPITECVDDTLDTFVFTVKAYKRELFEEFDVVEFTVINNGVEQIKQMVVASDVSSIYQKQLNPPTYQHTLTIVESTKILEKFKIHNLNLTNVTDTLLDQATKAIQNAVTLVTTATREDKCIFTFLRGFRSLLADKPSEDFYFSNTDLRAVMDGILQSNNCRCEVTGITFNEMGDISQIAIGYRSLAAVQEVEPEWTKEKNGAIVYEELKNSAQDYAGKLYSKGVNTICKNSITVTDMFKSGNATIDTNNARVMLPYPISEKGFESFIINVYRYKLTATTPSFPEYLEVDIAKKLILLSDYEVLSAEDQKRYIPFEIGATSIELFQCYKSIIFTKFNLEDILRDILPDTVDEHPWLYDIKDYTLNHPFTCTYYPQITTYSEVTKPGVYEKDRMRMGIWDNQTENNLDMDRHGKHLLSLIRRTGNGEQYIDVDADYYSNLLPLMSKIKDTGYVVYKREIAVYDLTCKCRYYLSKDFNAVQTKSGVNRVKHLYDIPLESDECPLIVKQYMTFSKKAPTHEKVDTTLDGWVLGFAMETLFRGRNSDRVIQYMLFQTVGGDGKLYPQNTENENGEFIHNVSNNRFMRPCVSYGQGKSINFIASVLDNYSVDYARGGYHFSFWGDGGNRMTYSRYVSKETSTVGECNKFSVDLAYSCKILNNPTEHADVYNEFINWFPITNIDEYSLATNQPYEINYIKDRTQKPVFIISFECIPAENEFNDIIIGTAFCRLNILVSQNINERKLYVLKSGRFYDSDDTLDGKDYVEVGDPADYFVVSGASAAISSTLSYRNTYSGEAYTAWAIADSTTKEILIACNGALCDIYAYISNSNKT